MEEMQGGMLGTLQMSKLLFVLHWSYIEFKNIVSSSKSMLIVVFAKWWCARNTFVVSYFSSTLTICIQYFKEELCACRFHDNISTEVWLKKWKIFLTISLSLQITYLMHMVKVYCAGSTFLCRIHHIYKVKINNI